MFLLEPFITLESEAAQAAAVEESQSVSTCTDVDVTQFSTTLAAPMEALKQAETVETARADGSHGRGGPVLIGFEQQLGQSGEEGHVLH